MKFNKDTFSANISNHVQNAIDKNIITKTDRDNNDLERLHGFIQYELLEYCKDRTFAIDVLRAIEFDQTRSWEDLQKEFGEFKSLLDIALVNLFLYLKSLGLTEYSAYTFEHQKESSLVDFVHDKTAISDKGNDSDTITLPSEDAQKSGNNVPDDRFLHRDNNIGAHEMDDMNDFGDMDNNDFGDDNPSPFMGGEKPRRKIRIAK